MPIGVMARPCQCCRGWSKKKHSCTHQFCDKPCKKQEAEASGVPLVETKQTDPQSKQSLIQQQIRNVYLETMKKMQKQEQVDFECKPSKKPDLLNPLDQFQLIANKSMMHKTEPNNLSSLPFVAVDSLPQLVTQENRAAMGNFNGV